MSADDESRWSIPDRETSNRAIRMCISDGTMERALA
jgi:hypothetical protein